MVHGVEKQHPHQCLYGRLERIVVTHSEVAYLRPRVVTDAVQLGQERPVAVVKRLDRAIQVRERHLHPVMNDTGVEQLDHVVDVSHHVADEIACRPRFRIVFVVEAAGGQRGDDVVEAVEFFGQRLLKERLIVH